MRATTRAVTLAVTIVTAFAHADDESDSAADRNSKAEAVAAAQAEMEAARAQMEAARMDLQEAAGRLAKVTRQHITWGQNRAYLGVLIGDQSEDGIVVAGVTPAGGAEAAGIESDDVIVAINGESLTGQDQPLNILHGVLDDVAPGGEVELRVYRDGNIETHEVTTTPSVVHIESQVPMLLEKLGQAGRVQITPAAPLTAPRPWLNLMGALGGTEQLQLVDIGEDLGDYFGVDGGVLVLNAPGKSELKPGDVLRRIDGADVGSANEAYRLLAATSGENAEVEIRRKNRKAEVTVAKGSARMFHQIHAMPNGKATIIVDGPGRLPRKMRSILDTEVEVKKDDEE